jgi:hypothetical protein
MTTMLNTKNVLMLVILSAGLLTVITGTGVSNVTPVFADDDDCEDNGDDSCNEQTQKIKLENDCKIVAKIENDDKSDENSNSASSSGDITCSNSIFSDDDEVSNEPGDVLICHRPTGNPTQEQTMSLSQNAADSHLNNHPFDELGACPTDDIFGPIS